MILAARHRSLPVLALVAALAVYAWFASPQAGGVLDEAAAALEEAGIVRLRTTAQPPGSTVVRTTHITADFGSGMALIEEPEPGIQRRIVVAGDTYDLLVDGTWLQPEGVPELFGQDLPGQLRAIDGRIDDLGGGRYRIRTSDAIARLDVDRHGLPRRYESALELGRHRSLIAWEVLEVVGRGTLDDDVPARPRRVSAEDHQELVARARGAS